jgi:hypothetical protein
MTPPSLIAALIVAALPSVQPCSTPTSGLTATAVLRRAASATGMSDVGGALLHLQSQMIRELRDLSDRSYPPFDAAIADEDIWFDPTSGVERTHTPGRAGKALWSGPLATMVGDDSLQEASVAMHGFARWQKAFNAWAVIAEWTRRGDAVLEGQCMYRDYHRIALRRPTPDGFERLLINGSDGLPIALLRREESYFLGPESVEYLYLNWDRVGSALYPLTTMRLVDGKKDRLRSVRLTAGGTALVPRDSGPSFPSFASPIMSASVAVPPQPFWSESPPDTVRVGPHTFLLVNPSFTSALALAADTVFILDATQNERRARQDSAWIGRLFPGKHPLAFIVSTDIWPHIAGLRYWVANGAKVIAHPATLQLVTVALGRRWTVAPDLFEHSRARVGVRIDTVRAAQARAGGALDVFAVDGAASEGVLAAYLPGDGFLWASDRVQDIANPSLYVSELWQATQRLHLMPRWTSGPHLRVIPWSTVDSLAKRARPNVEAGG